MQEKLLTQLKVDETAIIKELQGGCCFQRRMCVFGLKIDNKICVIAKHLFSGPIVIELLDSFRTQIVIGYGMASKVVVNTES